MKFIEKIKRKKEIDIKLDRALKIFRKEFKEKSKLDNVAKKRIQARLDEELKRFHIVNDSIQ